jgi:membrane glycosyltransferase
MTTARCIAGTFLGAVLSFYLVLCVPVLVFAPSRSSLTWVLFAVSYSCLALALALDLSEVGLGSALPPHAHPKLDHVCRNQTRVAVLYVCCDDHDLEALRNLRKLAGVDVYVLDDSEVPASCEPTDLPGLQVVRRKGRLGFKAGNLNHWLELYGANYRYFIILDSDSLISTEAIWELVAYAEHPGNRDVAIVQSSIQPRPGNQFQQLLGCHAGPRLHVLRRLHDRIGWSLSHGHNNLHRVAAILAVGGFGLAASCEDTVVSLDLVRQGWRIILVDTASHDAEPESAFSFRRREVRWGRQTAEIIRAFSGRVTWLHKCLLARHLLSYLSPLLSVALLGLISTTAELRRSGGWRSLHSGLHTGPQGIATAVLSCAVLGPFVLLMLLRWRLFRISGGDLRTFLSSGLLAGALAAFCCLQVTTGMARSFLFSCSRFIPTGKRAHRDLRLTGFWHSMIGSWMLYAALALVFMARSGLAFLSLNLFWIATLVAAPAVLWHFHRDQRRACQQ